MRAETDVKKIQIRGDKFTSQKNLFGDKAGVFGEYEAKIMPDGSSFKFDIKKDTGQEMRKGVPEGSLADATRLASTNSITQNTKMSTPSEGKYDLADDATYLSAVERGDMETAQRMVDEAAK